MSAQPGHGAEFPAVRFGSLRGVKCVLVLGLELFRTDEGFSFIEVLCGEGGDGGRGVSANKLRTFPSAHSTLRSYRRTGNL